MTYKTFDNIQVLRAVAAIAVVACHAWQTNLQYTSESSLVPHSVVAFFTAGVDLFFVISGFVIYYSTENARLSAKTFALRRLQRIVPLYWLLTLVFFTALLLLPQLKSSAMAGWPKLFASLTFTSGFLGFGNPVIYPGWTLEYEMAFYTLTALALVISPKRAWAIVAVVLCVAQASHWLLDGAMGLGLEFATGRVTLSFMGGIVIAQWLMEGRPRPVEAFAFALGIASAVIEDPSQRAIVYGLPSAAWSIAPFEEDHPRQAACWSNWATRPTQFTSCTYSLSRSSAS